MRSIIADTIDINTNEDDAVLRPKRAAAERIKVKADDVIKLAGEALKVLRGQKPLVCNFSATGVESFVSNAVLAIGARVGSVNDSSEVSSFVESVKSIFINVGSLTKTQAEVIRAAVSRANTSACPWVLDPMGVGTLSLRTYLSKELMRRFPALISGSVQELLELTGLEIARTNLAALSEERIITELSRFATVTKSALIAYGAKVYVITENAPVVVLEKDGDLANSVFGFQAVRSAIASAFFGALTKAKRFESSVSAAVVCTAAAAIAEKKAKAPGSFASAFLDALYTIQGEDLKSNCKVKVID
ncbi:MAG: hydroxyethylthiazole kinase [Kiritimatiellae bacterium]|nr:hydroxyethylthiazole kinase [Kiritimatiellia bacterium]